MFKKDTGFGQQKDAEYDEEIIHSSVRPSSHKAFDAVILGEVHIRVENELLVVVLR